MGYQYRGTIHEVEETPEPRRPLLGEFEPSKCGTYPGYRAHQNYDAPACQPCKDAKAAYHRELRARAPKRRKPTMRNQCATYPGYMRHKRSGEDACDLCKHAYAIYMRDYRERRAA